MIWILLLPLIFLLTCVVLSLIPCRRQKQKVFIEAGSLGIPFEEVSFTTADGICLRGLWFPSSQSKRTILFLHGYAGTYDPDLKYLQEFHDQGFNALFFNFRAHGNSGGRYTTIGALEREDCQAALRFAIKKGSRAIGLAGFSMGGRVAILSAPYPKEVKALLSDGGPARLRTVMRVEMAQKGLPNWAAAGFAFMIEVGMCICSGKNIFRIEPINQAGNLSPLPVLFIHGDHDPYTRLDELETMARKAGKNAQIWRVAEAGHRDADVFRPREYNDTILKFFEKWVSEP